MFRIFIVIAVVILEIRASKFTFSVTKDLQTARELQSEKWSYVEITGLPENDNVTIDASIPLSISFSEIFVFFANADKEILQVHINETLRGKFYEMPYKIVKEMSSENSTIVQTDKFLQISGIFPRLWLPDNCNKISAAVTDVDGNLYNYYWLKNIKISIPDLLITEEYKCYFPSL